MKRPSTTGILTKILGLVFFLILLSPVHSAAESDPRALIEQAYQRTYKAAALKYRPGMHGHRTADFKAYDTDGLEADPKIEKAWLQNFLSQALKVEETGEIINFKLLSPQTAECEVIDTLTATLTPDLQKKTIVSIKLVSHSKDQWKLTPKGWKQSSCRLIEQTYEETPVKGAVKNWSSRHSRKRLIQRIVFFPAKAPSNGNSDEAKICRGLLGSAVCRRVEQPRVRRTDGSPAPAELGGPTGVRA